MKTREEYEKEYRESMAKRPYWLTCAFNQGEEKWYVCEVYIGEPLFQGNGGYKYVSGACCSEKSAVRWWRRHKKSDKTLRTMSFGTLTK